MRYLGGWRSERHNPERPAWLVSSRLRKNSLELLKPMQISMYETMPNTHAGCSKWQSFLTRPPQRAKTRIAPHKVAASESEQAEVEVQAE